MGIHFDMPVHGLDGDGMKLKDRLKSIGQFGLDRLGESTTWQAIGFVASLGGSRFAGMDWGQGAALGGLVSAFIKTMTKG